MEITGRLTRDAVVVKTAKDRQVVNFSIAVNDTYKTKDSNEVKKKSLLLTARTGSLQV